MPCNRPGCRFCVEKRKELEESTEAAMKHLDALGVDPDSIDRGLVKIHLACQADPFLNRTMKRVWPTDQMLCN